MTIRVLIVDDSRMAREILRDIFEEEEDFVVVGEAENGQKAQALALELQPNLITMDLEMPVMDGYQAIEEIMQTKALPILVVSSVADADNAYKAISMGAVDAILKPSIAEEERIAFVKKARLISKIPVIKRIRKAASLAVAPEPVPVLEQPVEPVFSSNNTPVKGVGIASSTGGPQALAELLKDFDLSMNVPVFIAQHISDGFANGMAHWLDSICPLAVKVGEEGEKIQNNTVYISPSEKNMVVTTSQTIKLMDAAPGDIYHPSCNLLLESVAAVYGHQTIGIILSGMGSDGTKGLQKIIDCDGMTFGQDEESSVIYGMNQVAMNAGVVKRQLPLKEIAPAVKTAIALGHKRYMGAP